MLKSLHLSTARMTRANARGESDHSSMSSIRMEFEPTTSHGFEVPRSY